jgi:outer membrane protein insertion porin family
MRLVNAFRIGCAGLTVRRGFCFSLFVCVLLFSACRTTRCLAPGEQLYIGSTIHIKSELPVNKSALNAALEKVQRPKPNASFLSIRPKLWIWCITGADKGKGLRHWLKKKAGEPPVLMSTVSPEKTMELMKNRLMTKGFFHPTVSYEVKSRKRKTQVVYTVTLPAPYLIERVDFPSPGDSLETRIAQLKETSLLKQGVQYDLDLFKEERLRIDNELKNEGFYYFNPGYLLFKADSVRGVKKINVSLTLKPEMPDKARKPYRLNNIYIIPGIVSQDDSAQTKVDTVRIEGYYYLDRDSSFRPKAILKGVFLKKGELYSRKKHNLTLNHLMGMGTFKFVEIRFEESGDSIGKLDAYIRLNPVPRKSVTADLEAITKSNNYTGPAMTLSFKNRNLFRGAELFVFNLLGSFETQFTGYQSGFNSYEFGANTQLYFPEFITPFKISHVSSEFLPKTKIDLGFRVLQRVLYYNMTAMNLSFGYKWKETAVKEHELDPVTISFAKLGQTTEAFRTLLQNNPFLRKSFQEQFIIGSAYGFTYNSQLGTPHRSQYYFNGTVQVSGNTFYLAQSLFAGKMGTEGQPFKLFGYTYSQYTRFTADGRYYFNLNKNSKLATRLMGGIGVPYGNKSTMPYIKQFFSGGSNSLRAFTTRSVGPGSYAIPQNQSSQTFLDHSGDIKMECNIEYRFNIISILKGALFADAGNVWLIRKNDQLPGGEFHLNQFQHEIAVGGGIGLRFDLTFFVLRFDLACPFRKPYLPESERWVLNKIDFSNPSWRRQNLVLNIAIGYPF